jgi:hypothetical protein
MNRPLFILHQLDFAKSAQINLKIKKLFLFVSVSADNFSQFWKTLAKIFRSQSSVLGYELLNEPWAGNIFEEPIKHNLFFCNLI